MNNDVCSIYFAMDDDLCSNYNRSNSTYRWKKQGMEILQCKISILRDKKS